MTLAYNISPKKRNICIGDLRNSVQLQVRAIGAKSFNSSDPDYSETFTKIIDVWAAVKTTRGYQSFSDVGIENNITHLFYIRYLTDYAVTSEDWIEFNGEKYDIKDVENLEERNKFLILYCIKRGTKENNANLS